MKSKYVQNNETRMAVFKGKQIRKIIHENEWWFSVIDVVGVLTDSVNPRDYWFKMKIREQSESDVELSTLCRQLKLEAPDKKMRETDCANTEGIFRIIQSIPSPKAEPFKRWLAKVGYERIQEIEDPELSSKRARATYLAKGYPADWVEKRMRSIAIREELTDEWKQRGVKEDHEYAILTAEISKATFGLTPAEYKQLKGLKRENLRDHMEDLELLFSMLGEAATTKITRNRDAQGFDQSKEAAHEGGSVAGRAREDLEKRAGQKVVTAKNYLGLADGNLKKKLKT